MNRLSPDALLSKEELLTHFNLTERDYQSFLRRGLPFIAPEGGRGPGRRMRFRCGSIQEFILSLETRLEAHASTHAPGRRGSR